MSIIDDFLRVNRKIQQDAFIGKTNKEDLENLKSITKQLIEQKFINENQIDFTNDQKFLQSVNTFVRDLLAKS